MSRDLIVFRRKVALSATFVPQKGPMDRSSKAGSDADNDSALFGRTGRTLVASESG